MFTGLIEHSGIVVAIDRGEAGATISIKTELAPGIGPGDSIAVNGVCLTATGLTPDTFTADVMNETLDRTTLGELNDGEAVNLELPLAIGARLDGHIVQGHVDGIGSIASARDDGFARVVRLTTPNDLAKYVVEKGSIAIDGVSLTVSAVGEDWLEVSLIPETLERTTLGGRSPGDHVNLEADVLAKHVERLLSYGSGASDQQNA
ncbi:MAG: riboflavin synthase [Actinobacteria bacterium]|nr:riboflavin synthase [Actinomycetota bacterium]